ncbi:sec1 family domain-containing protein 1-like [Zophobas morio]|uniref:sec1 family domain-containing protein 1-like n=1 Tax=Zophobas morio TaxID=2755281 RepID=UPI003083E120
MLKKFDCKEQLYKSYYINFISAVPRPLLDTLATFTVENQCVHLISKVYDQYLNFVALEKDLFQLRYRNKDLISYKLLNSPKTTEADIQKAVSEIVSSLFSVLVTLGTVPLIRFYRGGAAEIVAKELGNKLTNHLKGYKNLFSGLSGSLVTFQRPLLILLDRNQDLATLLRHTWTYQALLHDVLHMELNKVIVQSQDSNGTPSLKSYALDSDSDAFWRKEKYSVLQDVLVANDEEVKNYSQQESSTVEGIKTSDVEKLTSAVNQVSVLRDKKALIEMHTNILSALMKAVNERNLNLHFEREQRCINRERQDKALSLFLQDTKGTPQDKLRVYLVHVLCDALSDGEKKKCEAHLHDLGVDLACTQYINQFKSFGRIAESLSGQTKPAGPAGMLERVTSKIVYHGTDLLSKGIQNVFPSTLKFPFTKIVDELMDNRGSASEDYGCFDPKLLQQSAASRIKSSFSNAIVFVVGGGNLAELHNLQEYAASCQPIKNIIYGSTELLAGDEFLQQLSSLAQD